MVTIDKQREFSAVGFGEVMLRLSPSGKERDLPGRDFRKAGGGLRAQRRVWNLHAGTSDGAYHQAAGQ